MAVTQRKRKREEEENKRMEQKRTAQVDRVLDAKLAAIKEDINLRLAGLEGNMSSMDATTNQLYHLVQQLAKK